MANLFRRLGLSAGFSFVSLLGYAAATDNPASGYARHAICILYPEHNSTVKGVVSFSQDSITQPAKIVCAVRGLKPNAKHGIHIHEFGDLTEGCTSAGAHFNPFNKTHGGLEHEERHAGDLGNLSSDYLGDSYMCIKNDQVTLYGEHSVLGRSVVVHEKQDDEGRGGNEESKKTGNSGARLACGVISLAKQFKTLAPR